MRVLIERELSPQEEQEWVYQDTATLDVSIGRLAVCGSLDFLCEQYSTGSEMVRTMSVAPGVYRVDLYSLYVGINGPAFNSVETSPSGIPLGTWFRETRGNTEFPLWLRRKCEENPALDPGFESCWKDPKRILQDVAEESETTWIEFIVKLTRCSQVCPVQLDENGFIAAGHGTRNLSSCPLGARMR